MTPEEWLADDPDPATRAALVGLSPGTAIDGACHRLLAEESMVAVLPPSHPLASTAVNRGSTPVMTEACQAGTCRTAQPMHAGKTMTPPSTTPISQGHSARDGRREHTHPR